MAVFARVIFGFVQWASRKGFAPLPASPSSGPSGGPSSDGDPKRLARRRTGVRGETFAYWYLRRHGYTS